MGFLIHRRGDGQLKRMQGGALEPTELLQAGSQSETRYSIVPRERFRNPERLEFTAVG